MTIINESEVKFLLPRNEEWESLKAKSEDDTDKSKAKTNRETLNQHLLSAMQMQNLVVLAGSGTSLGKPKGPSMRNLWEICTKDKTDYTDNAKSIFRLTGYDCSDDNKVNIEEFLSLCEACLTITNNSDIRGFIESCKGGILSACSFDKTDDILSGHKTFLHRLSRRRVRDSRLKLFTTNYDTCFEEAAGSHGIVVIDGFSFAKPRVYDPRFFDLDVVKRSQYCDSSDNYLEGVFQLYKLHGSVNWEKECNRIFEKEATPNGACMIFPAKGKYQQSYIQPHLELMARYLSSLREPNTCLIVSGFGFNDDHLSEPIIAAIKSNPYLKVIIADSSAEYNLTGVNINASRYWETLRTYNSVGEDVTFINASFEEFAYLIPDLRSLTPAERVFNAIKNI